MRTTERVLTWCGFLTVIGILYITHYVLPNSLLYRYRGHRYSSPEHVGVYEKEITYVKDAHVSVLNGLKNGVRFNSPRTEYEDNGLKTGEATHRLYAMLGGRLGNKLYNLAATYGLARTNHRTLMLPPKLIEGMQDFLNVSYLQTFGIAPAPSNLKTIHAKAGMYEPAMEHLHDSDAQVGPYLGAARYFEQYALDVRRFIVVRDDLAHSVQHYLQRDLPNVSSKSTLVGIHVRRTDRAGLKRQKRGQRAPNVEYLRRAMTYFLQKYRDVHFIVCSDDMTWCKQNETYLQPGMLRDVSKEEYFVHFSPPSATGPWDLALLSQCNHSIITMGTFGWWGAWLAGGETIYFNQTVKKASKMASYFDVRDQMWPSWIGMGDGTSED